MTNITKTAQIKKLENATQLIQLAEEGTRRNLYTIASALAIVDKNKLYEEGEYKNTAEYGEAMFNYKRATTSALIRVAVRFLNGSNSTLKQEGEKDYTIYQLMELLPMEDADINTALENGELNPYMTTKAIRDLAKSYKPVLEIKSGKESEIKEHGNEDGVKKGNIDDDARERQIAGNVQEDSENVISERISYAATDIAYYKELKTEAINDVTTVMKYLEMINDPSAQGAMEILNRAIEAVKNIVL